MHSQKRLMWCGLFVAAALMVTSCGGGDDDAEDSPETSAATTTEDGMTAPGTALQRGDTATVEFVPNAPEPAPSSTIEVAVTGVKKAKIGDLARFRLPDRAKNSGVYYVRADVKNVGDGNLAGTRLVLFGKVSDTLVVPPVKFGSPYARCDYKPFSKSFTQGKKTKVCMVILVPDKGTISEVQWRGPDDAEPISWPAS